MPRALTLALFLGAFAAFLYLANLVVFVALATMFGIRSAPELTALDVSLIALPASFIAASILGSYHYNWFTRSFYRASAVSYSLSRRLRTLCKKSQIECGEYEDDADVRHEPWPEVARTPEEQQIDADDEDYHRRDAEHEERGPCHIRQYIAPRVERIGPTKARRSGQELAQVYTLARCLRQSRRTTMFRR
ncbi:MAG TPA: hypothetical protein VMV50_03360 [Candidatus Paceibacterota bacterium]|nr:hypothetical protein [Candidatus Paceibacterota bacterium]